MSGGQTLSHRPTTLSLSLRVEYIEIVTKIMAEKLCP